MKRIFIGLLILGTALYGCKKNDPTDDRLPNTLCVQVTLDSDPSFDFITVTDNEGNDAVFKTDSGTFYKSVYYTTLWTGARPAYGFCLYDGSTPEVGEDHTASLCVPGTQTSDNSYEMMAGKVSEENGNFLLALRDPRAFLRISTDVDSIASVIVNAPGGEILGGDIIVNLDSLAADSTKYWVADKAGRTYSSLTLLPKGESAKDSCFKAGMYDIGLLPGFYSKGLEVKMLNLEGKTICLKTLGASSGYEMARNDVDLVEYEQTDTRPDTIRIVLDFYNENDVNPLGEFVAGSRQNSTAGETYYFNYEWEFDGAKYSEQIPFVVCKGTVAGGEYKYYAASAMVYGEQGRKILNFVKENWWIQTPAIKGRYLKSVTVSHGNNYNKRCFIYTGPGTGQLCSYTSNSAQAIATSEHLNVETMSFPNDLEWAAVHKTQMNTSYYLYGKSAAAIRLYKLEFIFTKNL